MTTYRTRRMADGSWNCESWQLLCLLWKPPAKKAVSWGLTYKLVLCTVHISSVPILKLLKLACHQPVIVNNQNAILKHALQLNLSITYNDRLMKTWFHQFKGRNRKSKQCTVPILKFSLNWHPLSNECFKKPQELPDFRIPAAFSFLSSS